LIILSGNIGANVFTLLSTTIFTRTMGAGIFGYYALIQTYLAIADRVFGFQTWQVFIKYAADFQRQGEKGNLKMLLKYCFLIDATAMIAGCAITLAFIPAFLAFFDFPHQFAGLVVLMAITLLCKIGEVSTGIFRVFDEFGIQSRILVYSALSKVVLFAVIAVVHPSFGLFIYATLASQVFMLFLKLYYARSVLARNGIGILEVAREPINKSVLREHRILPFAFFTNFVVTVRMVSRQLDVVLLGRVASPEIVGIYKIAKEVANLIGQLTDPVYNTIYPELAKLLSGKHTREAWRIAGKISLFGGLCGLAFFAAFLAFGKLGIRIGFGADFESAYGITCIYYAAIFMAIISLPVTPIDFALGLAKQAFWDQVGATVVYILAAVPLIHHFSAKGAAAAYSAYYAAWLALSFRTLWPRMRMAV
jgi:O-antigen/teichoic acid export membrane protein